MAIVNRDVFDAVQARLHEGVLMAHRNAKWDYLLTGFSRCGVCGRAVTGGRAGRIDKQHPRYWYFYQCTAHTVPDRESCTQHRICFAAQKAHEVVWDWIEGLLTNETDLEEGLDEMERRRENETHSLEERHNLVISRLTDTKKSIDRLTARIAVEDDEDIRTSFENQLSQIKAQRAGLQEEKEKTESKIHKIDVTLELKERIREKAARIRSRLNHPNFKDKRELLRDLRLKLVFYHNQDTGERTVAASCEFSLEPETLSLDAKNGKDDGKIVLGSC